MKKVVRTVWIGALSGLAFLAACCSTKGLSKAEKEKLARERDSIQDILTRREGAAVYGSSEMIARYGAETYRLRNGGYRRREGATACPLDRTIFVQNTTADRS